MNLLTQIISLRADDFSFYEPRLSVRSRMDFTGTETIVVDDGSAPSEASRIEMFCQTHGWRYLRLDTADRQFSLSRARNAGIFASATEWICFEDADLVYKSAHFVDLISELRLLERSPFNFLTVPVIYLLEEASNRVFEAGTVDAMAAEFISAALLENPVGGTGNQTVQSYAPASSVVALRRTTALLAGGFDERFEGWGGEDRDFVFRLLHLNNGVRDLPTQFEVTKNWNLNDTVTYEGWRSLYRLHGDYLAMKGIYGFHLHHDVLAWKGDQRVHNMQYAAEKARTIAKKKTITPAFDPAMQSDVVLGRNPHIVNAQVLSSLNNPRIVDEAPDQEPEEFAAQLAASEPGCVLMWNSFGTPWRRRVYSALSRMGVEVIVGERGALPNTMYFDAGGLCLESDSYRRDIWDTPITEDRETATASYLHDLKYGEQALEKQSSRIGAALLRHRLGLSPDTKMLFVALQLVDDTVTTNLVEEGRDYQMFALEIQRLSVQLPQGWVMVVKNHPLSLVKSQFPSVLYADEYHINDLLDASDAVCVYNSGVGLIGLAYGKPVITYGRAFYHSQGVTHRFQSASSLSGELDAIAPLPREQTLRFFSYLIHDFYSFAEWSGKTTKNTEASQKFVMENIHYSVVRVPGRPPRNFTKIDYDFRRSALFDRYRHFDYVQAKPTVHTIPAREAVKTAALLFDDGKKHFDSGNFSAAAEYFDRASKVATDRFPSLLRASAEAYDKLGKTSVAVERLKHASRIAKNSKAIDRRIRELQRPRWLRRIRREKEYPIPASFG